MKELFKLIADYREKWAAQAEFFGPEYDRRLADAEPDDDDNGVKKFEEWAASQSETSCYEEAEGKAAGSGSKKSTKAKGAEAEVVREASEAEPAGAMHDAPKKAPEEASEPLDEVAAELEDLSPEELAELKRMEEKIAALEAEVSVRPWGRHVCTRFQ